MATRRFELIQYSQTAWLKSRTRSETLRRPLRTIKVLILLLRQRLLGSAKAPSAISFLVSLAEVGIRNPPSKDTSSDEAATSSTTLTRSKAQFLSSKTETKQPDDVTKDGKSSGTDQEAAAHTGPTVAVPAIQDHDADPVQDPFEASMGEVQGGQGPNVEPAEVGLGISTIASKDTADGEVNSKKKKKPKSKKKKSAGDSVGEPEEEASISENKAKPEMFRFGEDSTPTRPADDCSDASSHTMGRSTPSSGLQSPTLSTSGRKLPIKSPGSNHLVEAITPPWKHKKRVMSGKASDTVPELNTDDEVMWIVNRIDISDDELTSQIGDAMEPSEDGSKEQPYLVYVGAPRKEDAEGFEVEESKAKLQQLAREELRRKHAIGRC